jgi:hypothetical protein
VCVATEGDGAFCVGLCTSTPFVRIAIALIYGNAEPPETQIPPRLTPHYAVVIESAGTRDNALVSKHRMVVRTIVRAISDALVSRG